MRPKHKKFPLDASNKSTPPLKLNGLNSYEKSLEKIFFADVCIQSKSKDSKSLLTININCNYNIAEALFQLKESNWGSICEKTLSLEHSPFQVALLHLQKKNTCEIIIDEIAIHFKDTSLYVSKIDDYSILDELCNIFDTLSENFVYLTKGLSESLYEIFIPVFEKSTTENKVPNTNKQSYYTQWGVEYHSEEYIDGVIYDLKTKTIIETDLELVYKK